MGQQLKFAQVLTILFCGLILLVRPVAASWANPFEQFYSTYNHGLQEIIRDKCSEQYALYLEDRRNVSAIRPELRSFGARSMTKEVMECLLENSPEMVKSKMAAAAIVLGLAPTIISTLGVRPQDTAVLSIVGRQHILALAVAVGSPALNAYRASEYESVIDNLRDTSLKRPRAMRKLDPVISAILYALAGASIANIGELTYRIGAQAIFTILPDTEYLALLWAFLGVVIHIMAAITMRVRLSSRVEKAEGDRVSSSLLPANVAKDQVDIVARRSKILFRVHPETLLFYLLSLITTVLTACHIIYGTLVFSSIWFISINDSLSIVARLMASAIVCRIILTFELLVLRESVTEEASPNGTETKTHVLSFK